MNRLLCGLVFSLLLLPGCTGASRGALEEIVIPPTAGLAPESFGGNLYLSQIVTGTFDGKTRSLRFESEIQPDRLTVVCLTHTGVVVFAIEQTSSATVISERAPNSIPFDPERILTDFKLVHWPLEVLSPVLESRGFRLTEEGDGNSHRRILLNAAGEVIMEITGLKGNQGEVLVRRHDIPYDLKIITLSREEAAS